MAESLYFNASSRRKPLWHIYTMWNKSERQRFSFISYAIINEKDWPYIIQNDRLLVAERQSEHLGFRVATSWRK